MKEPILLIMAAGMGSRYGGLKQIDPVGPCGEVILDYSIFDARRAGFKRVVFLIKHAIEKDFKERVGSKIEKYMDVQYVYQEVDCLPDGFSVPEGRTKPWGIAHAVMLCRNAIDAPFAVINADDYYGIHAFKTAYDYLISPRAQNGSDIKAHFMMVGYSVKNTLTDNGYVSRGICTVNDEGYLTDVNETTHIISSCDGPLYTLDGKNYTLLDPNTIVSMNMWGFTTAIFDALEKDFTIFLKNTVPANPIKAECYLPSTVSNMLNDGTADVLVHSSEDKWYGITHKEDRPQLVAALEKMTAEGLYPAALWE